MVEVIPERWFAWYLLGKPSERGVLVSRMKKSIGILSDLPVEPAFSQQLSRILFREALRRFSARVMADLGDRPVWWIDSREYAVQIQTWTRNSPIREIMPSRDLWKSVWERWLIELDVLGAVTDGMDVEAEALGAYIFDLPSVSDSPWWFMDIISWRNLGRGKSVIGKREKRLLQFDDYETWPFSVRATALEELPRIRRHGFDGISGILSDIKVDQAITYWTSFKGVLAEDDGRALQMIIRKGVETDEQGV